MMTQGKQTTGTRDRLVTTAARLFRHNGYHGVGVAQILAESGAPKGSLYHHFPKGKADLALAAADWASAGMLAVIDDAFRPAEDFAQGITTLCHKLAKFFDISDFRDGCPVSTVLFQDPENEAFRTRTAEIFEAWIDHVVGHGERLGVPRATARQTAELLLLTIQGAWVMARAQRSSNVLRAIPSHLGFQAATGTR